VYCFLRAKETKTPGERLAQKNSTEPYTVIEHGGALFVLKITLKPYVTFQIRESGLKSDESLSAVPWLPVVEGHEIPNVTIKLHPVAQLRSDHALALCAAAGADATRVGVDRVEFVRSRFCRH
jgi:hypothetical protein